MQACIIGRRYLGDGQLKLERMNGKLEDGVGEALEPGREAVEGAGLEAHDLGSPADDQDEGGPDAHARRPSH